MRSSRIKTKINKYIEKARFSNVAKSTRRLLFNHLNLSVEQRGHFHVDQMYGSGSGVLIRYEGVFFLLTAKHVIDNNIPGRFQNESPFWVTSKFQGEWKTLFDFMFPRVIWNIGDLISETCNNIDLSDICLVELFYPRPFHYPNHFVEIAGKNSVLSKKELFEGQFLLVTGYPFEKNAFDFTPLSDMFTHSTSLHRHTIPGQYVPDEGVGHISFELVEGGVTHSNVNGMSGGTVYNVQPKANQVKLAGIPVTAGDNICRFIPCHVFIDAILNYRSSSCRVVDPIALNEPPIEEQLKLYAEYLRAFDPRFAGESNN